VNPTDTLSMSFLPSACELIHIIVYLEATAVIVLKLLGTVSQDLTNEAICAQDLFSPAEGNIFICH
jgi:hypothetical protein